MEKDLKFNEGQVVWACVDFLSPRFLCKFVTRASERYSIVSTVDRHGAGQELIVVATCYPLSVNDQGLTTT
jgi:hypothetical protein